MGSILLKFISRSFLTNRNNILIRLAESKCGLECAAGSARFSELKNALFAFWTVSLALPEARLAKILVPESEEGRWTYILEILLCCCVQSEKREQYVTNILDLTTDVQTQLMTIISKVIWFVFMHYH